MVWCPFGAGAFNLASDFTIGAKESDGSRTNAREYTIIAIPKSSLGIPRFLCMMVFAKCGKLLFGESK
jgi:hypothetical protein